MIKIVDELRRQRAEARRGRIVLRKGIVGEREADLSPISGAEAISLVTRLTRESWALSGRSLPRYPRSKIPVRFVPRQGT